MPDAGCRRDRIVDVLCDEQIARHVELELARSEHDPVTEVLEHADECIRSIWRAKQVQGCLLGGTRQIGRLWAEATGAMANVGSMLCSEHHVA